MTKIQKLENALRYLMAQAEEYNNATQRQTLSRLIARMTGAASSVCRICFRRSIL